MIMISNSYTTTTSQLLEGVRTSIANICRNLYPKYGNTNPLQINNTTQHLSNVKKSNPIEHKNYLENPIDLLSPLSCVWLLHIVS